MESDTQYNISETLQDSELTDESLKFQLHSVEKAILSVPYFFILRVMPH